MTPAACIAVGALVLPLKVPEFTLRWTHSVERVAWVEHWQVTPEALVLESSALKGSGAGMEPGPEARLVDGWWISPGGAEVEQLVLAASGATSGGWTLCADGTCREIGSEAGEPLVVAPCDTQNPTP